MSGPHDTYEAVVVGAGPAGIVAVGNLLEKKIDKILWVDESFQGGRVNQYYREVPSNTKTKLFVEFAEMVSPFQKIVTGTGEDKLKDVRKLPQEQGCQLSNAADICLVLTSGLKETPGVIAQIGRVASATLDSSSDSWNVNLDNSEDISNVQAKRLILCTGSTPLDPKLPNEPADFEHINLDDALSPTNLKAKLSSLGPTTVAVIGASHSAVLVLMNLSKIALESKPDLKVKWFTRHGLRYAEYDDSGHVSARDNTGLKGQAAVWAKENLEPEKLSTSPVGKVVQMISYQKGDEAKVYGEHLGDAQFVVQAIGYTKNALPTLTANGEIVTPTFDHDKGIFEYTTAASGESRQLPGVYGAGIAFPKRIVDQRYGHTEFNVGFMKFMKAVKGWVEEWKPVA